MEKFILGGYIAWFVTLGITSVGKISDRPQEPYTWSLPVTIFIISVFPAILGYLIGKRNKG